MPNQLEHGILLKHYILSRKCYGPIVVPHFMAQKQLALPNLPTQVLNPTHNQQPFFDTKWPYYQINPGFVQKPNSRTIIFFTTSSQIKPGMCHNFSETRCRQCPIVPNQPRLFTKPNRRNIQPGCVIFQKPAAAKAPLYQINPGFLQKPNCPTIQPGCVIFQKPAAARCANAAIYNSRTAKAQ